MPYLFYFFPLFSQLNQFCLTNQSSTEIKIDWISSTSLHAKHSSTNCSLCNKPIPFGQKYILDFWKNKIHDYHYNEGLGTCYSCSRLVHPGICGTSVHEKGGDQFFDGRWVCNHCIREGNLVFFSSDAELITNEIFTQSETLGIKIPKIFLANLVFEDQLALVRKNTLREGEKNPALTAISISQKIYEAFLNTETQINVLILNGLHETFFKLCMAHELMHVWIAANCSFRLDPRIEEGLCNYFAYKIIEMDPYSEYQRFYLYTIQNNPDPIYGVGYKMIKNLEEKFPHFPDLVNYIKFNPEKFRK